MANTIKAIVVSLIAVWSNTVERIQVNGQWQNKADALGNRVYGVWIRARTQDLSKKQIIAHKEHGLSAERIRALGKSYPELKYEDNVDYVYRSHNDFEDPDTGEVKFRYFVFAPPETEVSG